MSDIEKLKCILDTITSKEDYDKREAGVIKRKITCLEKYGVEHPMKNSSINNKRINTNIDKYGRVNGRGFGSEYASSTIIAKYGSSGFSSEELASKAKDTMKARYLVDNASKSSYIRRKTKLTNLSRYGVTNVSKLPSVKRKKEEKRRSK